MIKETQKAKEGKQAIIDGILSDLPCDTAIEVELPSECKIYELQDPGAPITLRPMTFEDEKSLLSSKEQDPINVILQKCLTNLSVMDLLPLDKLYLIMKLREISYGDDYNTLLICNHCKTENPVTVQLSELNVNPVPDDFEDPIEVTLPKLGKSITIRLPRVRDEKVFNNTEDSLDQLWRFVVSIDGHTDKSIISAVVDQLPLVDVKTILKAIKTDFGLDTNIKLQCDKCGGVSVIDLPITANFFDVS